MIYIWSLKKNMNSFLFTLKPLIKAKIIKRPSSSIKSPYVADIQLVDDDLDIIDNTIYLAHTPALGCCGLSDNDSIVLVSENNGKTKTKYTIEISCFYETKNNESIIEYISLKPKNAEYVAYEAINQNKIHNLPYMKLIEKEKKFENSRFDFFCVDINDNQHIIEIKTVPLAYYVDTPKKDYKLFTDEIKNKNVRQKISYFPDGYRKNKNDAVSPRALKHIQELEKITLETNIICTLLYIVQRTDVELFQPSNLDMIYKKAVQKAWLNGVKIKVIQIKWNEKGEALLYSNFLPIHIFDYHGPYRIEDL